MMQQVNSAKTLPMVSKNAVRLHVGCCRQM